MSAQPDFDPGRRETPADIRAEQSVLGGMMLSREARDEVLELLDGSEFYRPQHEVIFQAIEFVNRTGDPVDAVVVSDRLNDTGELDRVGGFAYLHTLIHSVPTAANASYYARIVQKMATRRAIIAAGTRVVQIGYQAHENDTDPADMVNAAQAEVMAVDEGGNSDDLVLAGATLESAIDAIEAAGKNAGVLGVPSGFKDLDALTGGFQPGQLIVFAARPSIGKSTMMMDCARAASIAHGMASAVFSLEMSKAEIAMRLLSAEGRVELNRIRSGKLAERDWTALAQAAARIGDAPMYLDDSPGSTVARIASKARQLVRSQGLRILFVDYLQLMSSGKKVESRQQEVSEFSRALKLLAKELEIPVVALSQLNRGPEQRTDKKPQISDLRESGGIENDADMVILLNREDFYEPECTRAGEADFIVAKHRNGKTDTITVAFQGHYSRFVDMATDEEPATTSGRREDWSSSDVLKQAS